MDDFTAELQAFSQRVLNKEPQNETTQPPSFESPEKEVVLYQTDDGNIDVSVYYYEESFWLTQKAMGELFGVASNTITYHLQEIFKSGELVQDSVTRIFRATASDGKKYNTKFYNLDAIISVGYRVNSIQATKFRQWATATLKELLFAITGHTAPELIYDRVDSTREHMGLTTWKNAPDGKILKSDVTVSKNYLSQDEMSGLNDVVNMYLDYAENQAKRNKLMSMNDWVSKL